MRRTCGSTGTRAGAGVGAAPGFPGPAVPAYY